MSDTEQMPVDRVTEIDAATAPVREEYEQVKAARRLVMDQITTLADQEKELILKMNQLGDQLETLRLEKQAILSPKRMTSGRHRRRA